MCHTLAQHQHTQPPSWSLEGWIVWQTLSLACHREWEALQHLRARVSASPTKQLLLVRVSAGASFTLEINKEAVASAVKAAVDRKNEGLRRHIEYEKGFKVRSRVEKAEQAHKIATIEADLEDELDKDQRTKHVLEEMYIVRNAAAGFVHTPGGVVAQLLPTDADAPIASRIQFSWLPDRPCFSGPHIPSKSFDSGYSPGWAAWLIAEDHGAVQMAETASLQGSVTHTTDCQATYMRETGMNHRSYLRKLPVIPIDLTFTIGIVTPNFIHASLGRAMVPNSKREERCGNITALSKVPLRCHFHPDNLKRGEYETFDLQSEEGQRTELTLSETYLHAAKTRLLVVYDNCLHDAIVLTQTDGNEHRLELSLSEGAEPEAASSRLTAWDRIRNQSTGKKGVVRIVLNEFNHCVQTFPSAESYERSRSDYLSQVIDDHLYLEDAITGLGARVLDVTVKVSILTSREAAATGDASLRIKLREARLKQPEQFALWSKVRDVTDLVQRLCLPSPRRLLGVHAVQHVLIRSQPSSGKTWCIQQLAYCLATQLQKNHTTEPNPVRLVPLVCAVKKLFSILHQNHRAQVASDGEAGGTNADFDAWLSQQIAQRRNLLLNYIEFVYAGEEKTVQMLRQAFELRGVVLLLDGIDEAGGRRQVLENFVLQVLCPMGIRIVATSRPDGMTLKFCEAFTIMNLAPLTHDQEEKALRLQLEGDELARRVVEFSRVRRKNDEHYKKTAFPSALARNQVESFEMPDRFLLANGNYNPDMRTHILNGGKLQLPTLVRPDDPMTSGTVCALQHGMLGCCDDLDRMRSKAGESEELLQALLDAHSWPSTRVAANGKRLALLVQKRAEGRAADPFRGQAAYAVKLWHLICQRTDAIYSLYESLLNDVVESVLHLLEQCGLPKEAFTMQELKDPVALHEDAMDAYFERFQDGTHEACATDIIRTRIVCDSHASMLELLQLVQRGLIFSGHPSIKRGQQWTLEMLRCDNRFKRTDPMHYRNAIFHHCLWLTKHATDTLIHECLTLNVLSVTARSLRLLPIMLLIVTLSAATYFST